MLPVIKMISKHIYYWWDYRFSFNFRADNKSINSKKSQLKSFSLIERMTFERLKIVLWKNWLVQKRNCVVWDSFSSDFNCSADFCVKLAQREVHELCDCRFAIAVGVLCVLFSQESHQGDHFWINKFGIVKTALILRELLRNEKVSWTRFWKLWNYRRNFTGYHG